MTEMLRILTSEGEDAGFRVSRENAQEFELPHGAVHIWVIDENNRVLVETRADDKSTYPGMKHIVAGHLVGNEDGSKAGIRETGEEVGIKITEDDLIPLGRFPVEQIEPESNKKDKEYIDVFVLRVRSDEIELALQKSEVKDVEWIHIDDMEWSILNEYDDWLNHPQDFYFDVIHMIKNTLGIID